VVLRGESAVFAVLVDSIVDTEEIVVKPLPAHLAHMKVYLGATFLGVDGVCPVFDIEGLASTFGITQPDKHAYREGAGETPAGLEAALSASAKTAPGMAETGRAETGRAASALSFREILTFTLSGQASFAIDVPHVFRLEEVPASQVRFQFGSPVMVYRGETLPIILLEKSLVPTVARGFDAKAWLAAQTVLNLIVVEHLGRHAALVVGSIGEYRASEAPLDTSLARGDFAGCLDLGGTLATVLDVGRLLERLGVVQPEAQKPPPDVVPLVSSAAPQFAPAFDANGIAQDDGIVWVDVG
jgi:two-component system chemotaxis sensor kinase CheA